MKEHFKKILRQALYLIFSVYFLSIPISGKPLYSYARGILVENQVVSLVCAHSTMLFTQIKERIRTALIDTASPKTPPPR